MTVQQSNLTQQKIRGAEGLLDLEFYEDAAALLEELSGTAPQNFRVWLGMARVKSRNFTVQSPEVQPLLEKAAQCARTVDDYTVLQETAGWYAAIPPYTYARTIERTLPDTEQLARIKPIRIPLSSEEAVQQAREISRASYLKFLLAFVLIVGLPVGFIVSCSNGVNPIMNAIRGDDADTGSVPALDRTSQNSEGDTESRPASPAPPSQDICPYAVPTQDVSLNMTGDDVCWVQWSLSHCGSPIAISGEYNAETERMVLEFQKAQGIRVDGIVGIETRERLISLCK